MKVAILLLFAGLAHAQERARPSRVRVVDEAGKPVAGARVLFVTAPMPKLAPYYGQRIEETRTDQRGNARHVLDPNLFWCAWAVTDDGDKRRASVMRTSVVPGRPLRLVLRSFAVARFGWEKLANWKKQRGGEINVAFASEKVERWVNSADGYPQFAGHRPAYEPQAAGCIRVRFPVQLPSGDAPVTRLPPLPYGYYYGLVTDAKGGFLDARWVTPEFSSRPDSQSLYDRKQGIKRIPFGAPSPRNVRVVDASGRPIEGARIFCTHSSYHHELAREYTTGADGKCELPLPSQYQGRTSLQRLRGRVFAPGANPHSFTISASKTLQTWKLTTAPKPSWDVVGPLESDDEFVMQTTRFTVPIERTAEGRLQMPSLGTGSEWFVALVRRGRVIPLAMPRARRQVPAKQTFDLRKLRAVEVVVTSKSGGPAIGGFVEIRHADHPGASIGPRSPLDRRGRANIRLLPGKYRVFGWNTRRGDGFADLEVPETGPARVTIALEAFRQLRGTVVAKDGTPRAGVAVYGTADAGGTAHSVITGWSNHRVVTDKLGHFELSVSSFARAVTLHATHIVGGQSVSSGSTTFGRAANDVRLTIQ